MSWILDLYFWRQSFVVSSGIAHAFSTGMMVSLPSAMTPALLAANNTDISATSDQASWLASINGISGMFAFLIQAPVMHMYGRKPVYLIATGCLAISWLIILLANSLTMLFTARLIQGMAFGYLNQVIVGEYCRPNLRGYFITWKKVAAMVGALVCHFMPLYWTWRHIAGVAFLMSAVAFTMTCFWPESPSFLAYHGRYEDCERVFVWLNGKSAERDKELKSVIEAQMERRAMDRRIGNVGNLKMVYLRVLQKDFLKALLIGTLLTVIIYACGKYYFKTFIVQMMDDLLKDHANAIYYSVASDLLTLAALSVSLFVISAVNRRKILFVFGIISIVLMFTIFTLDIFNSKYKILKIIWIVPGLVILLNCIINIGVVPVCYTIVSEIFSLANRAIGLTAMTIVFSACFAITNKVTPLLMEILGLGSAFLFYAIIILLCLLVLYKILPETKDRTLQEIEDEMKDADVAARQEAVMKMSHELTTLRSLT